MLILTTSQPVDAPDVSNKDDTKDSVSNHSTPSVLKALQEAGLQNGQPGRQQPTLQPSPQGATGAQQELQLADIHLAAKPSAWPPAPGWWILSFLLLGLISFSIIKFTQFIRAKKYQKRILKALGQLEKKLQKDQSTEAISDINILLRRLALAHYPRKKIASLTGQDWLKFLDESGNTKDFTQGAGKLLADAPYLASIPKSADIKGLSFVVKKWVNKNATKQAVKASVKAGARVRDRVRDSAGGAYT